MKPSVRLTLFSFCIAVSALFAAGNASAGSLYLPVQLSPEIEARIERLFVIANMAIIKRPIPITRVNEALDRAADKDPVLVSSIRRYLDRYSYSAGVTHVSLELTGLDGDNNTAFNQRGMDSRSSYLVSAAAYWAVNDFVAVNVGGVAGQRASGDKEDVPEGSFISLGWDYLQADIGYRTHWFGPFQDSDMLISSHAAAMPGITLSNSQPLPWLGLQYELFLSQMSESDGIRSRTDRNERLTGNPLLGGVHLSLSPFDGFSIGVNRLLQFGGANRDQSLNGLFNAFFKVRESENVGISGQDFGNQLSSVTTRYTFAGEFPVSVYMQYAGEDTSLASSVHLGNSALMFGVHLPKLTKNLDFSWETAEWQNAWYTNGNYSDGLSQHGITLGHWGATQPGATGGATAQTVKLIWDIYGGQALSFKYQIVENKSLPGEQGHMTERFTIEYAHAVRNIITGLKVQSSDDTFGGQFTKLSGFIRW